jgi:hypothetical protein
MAQEQSFFRQRNPGLLQSDLIKPLGIIKTLTMGCALGNDVEYRSSIARMRPILCPTQGLLPLLRTEGLQMTFIHLKSFSLVQIAS